MIIHEVKVSGPDKARVARNLRIEADRLAPLTWRDLLGSHHWWLGVLFGVLMMALFDVTDLHICVGECDGRGYAFVSPAQGEAP